MLARLRSGNGPRSVRVRPSSIKRECDRRATQAGQGVRPEFIPDVAFFRAAALVGDVAPGDMAFWLEKSAVSLAMLMHLAAIQGYDMSAVYAWANKLGRRRC